ncbi:hypothetical protein [Kitasatospora cineracea]|uniref:hypothetical protein n=1 Tax=Kitasatospora cineracea TaxID=88074 RepID=UPI003821CCA9
MTVRFKHALLGGLTLSELWGTAKGEVASLAVSLIGAARCPESAGAGCLVMVGGSSGTLHTTSNHPFRDATTGTWTPVGELPGVTPSSPPPETGSG